jgi:hypothetical protein
MKRVLFFIALGAATTVVLALAAYFALGPFDPAKEVRRMQVAMAPTRSFVHKSGLSWTVDASGERVTTSILGTGTIGLQHPYALEHDTKFRLVRLAKGVGHEDISGEVRAVGDYLFQKIDPADVWVRYESRHGFSPLQSFAPALAPAGNPPFWPWPAETQAALRLLLAQADLLTVDFDGFTELVGGVNTRKMNVRFSPDATRNFLLSVIRARSKREPTDEERLAADRLAAFLEKLYVRLWIGVLDHRLYRLHAAGVIVEPSRRLAVDCKVELSDFDAPLALSAPAAFTLFGASESGAEVLPESATVLSPPPVSGADFAAPEAAALPAAAELGGRDADEDGLEDLLEVFYGTNPRDPDTDRDGVSDGDEVLSGRNPRGQGSLFGFGLGE